MQAIERPSDPRSGQGAPSSESYMEGATRTLCGSLTMRRRTFCAKRGARLGLRARAACVAIAIGACTCAMLQFHLLAAGTDSASGAHYPALLKMHLSVAITRPQESDGCLPTPRPPAHPATPAG